MGITTKLSVLFVGSFMLLAAFSSALALTGPVMAPAMEVISSYNGSSESTNWSGYAVTGETGSVTSVSESWIVPAVTGVSGEYAAFWTGIDGFSSSTVEQAGILAETTTSGSSIYYAWYDFYPSPLYEITSLTIKPSDTISASITYTGNSGSLGGPAYSGLRYGGNGVLEFLTHDPSSGIFTVTITDETTGESYTTIGTVANAARSSAEWMAEAPLSSTGVLPLANFGTAYYGSDYTLVSNTCFATVGGSLEPIGSFGSAVQTIKMVTNSGATKALPSGLSSAGTSFSITWDNAGP